MDTKDLLREKIDKARMDLPEDTRNAIDAVDWRAAILEIRHREGYDFIQLADLETETELLLCGLSTPEDYPKEIQKRMGISLEETKKLVAEMNEKVFKKIKEEMIKITEARKAVMEKAPPSPVEVGERPLKEELGKAGIQITDEEKGTSGAAQELESREEILGKIEKPTPSEAVPVPAALPPEEAHPLLAQKLSGPMQVPSSKTVHSLDNLTKPPLPATPPPAKAPSGAPQKYSEDPYREKPE
jgi:hypothetical protein